MENNASVQKTRRGLNGGQTDCAGVLLRFHASFTQSQRIPASQCSLFAGESRLMGMSR